MWIKWTKKLTAIKKLFAGYLLPVAIFFLHNTVDAQKLITVKGLPGLYYRTIEDLQKQQDSILHFYNFTRYDTIASIGAQSCNWEAAYAAVSDSLFFYLEDIDTTYCNFRQAAMAWQYYGRLKGSPLTCGYAIVTGDEKITGLPPRSCNKVLIINSFHEFTYPAEMLRDITGKLKPGGILYIDEALAQYSGELHPVCKKRLYLENELIEILEANGFVYKNSCRLMYRKTKPARELFAFTLKGQ
ncbi:MAG TPA: hypothetical protein VG738_04505 [Chitinophagaceae bacterium]|nr:hypothetical protein [Chitinophagaceae bacterium]